MADFDDLESLFSILRANRESLEPQLFQALHEEASRVRRIMREGDTDRRTLKRQLDDRRRDLDLMNTALLGLMRLSDEVQLEPFLQQALELISRLVGAEVGVMLLRREGASLDDAPRLITRRCQEPDLQFVREEVHQSRGMLRLAWAENRSLHLPREAGFSRVIEGLRTRHVRASLALPFGDADAQGARALLYLEHLTRPDAFDGELELIHECLRLVSGRINRQEVLEHTVQALDYTAPYRLEDPYPELIGRSPELAQQLKILELLRINTIEAPVFAQGPPGSGRSTLARVIHARSPRRRGPFQVVECQLHPEAVQEKLIFGDERSAGSSGELPFGQLERAHGGTLYLGQIEMLSPAAQQRLNRALAERRYFRVHGETPLRLDARIVCSSQFSLRELAQAQRFDEALAERLTLFEVKLLPLSQRRHDVAALADHFVSDVCRSTRRAPVQISRAALEAVVSHPWPGNLKELRRAVTGALALCPGKILRPAHFKDFLKLSEDLIDEPVHLQSWKAELDDFQRRMIRQAMHQAGGNVTQAAQTLDITRQYLNNRLRQLNLTELRGSQDNSQDDPNAPLHGGDPSEDDDAPTR